MVQKLAARRKCATYVHVLLPHRDSFEGPPIRIGELARAPTLSSVCFTLARDLLGQAEGLRARDGSSRYDRIESALRGRRRLYARSAALQIRALAQLRRATREDHTSVIKRVEFRRFIGGGNVARKDALLQRSNALVGGLRCTAPTDPNSAAVRACRAPCRSTAAPRGGVEHGGFHPLAVTIVRCRHYRLHGDASLLSRCEEEKRERESERERSAKQARETGSRGGCD